MYVLCHKLFVQSEDGRRLHELLTNAFIVESPILNMMCPYYKDLMLVNEGRNQLIRDLKSWAEQYEQIQKVNNEVSNDGKPTTSTEFDSSSTAAQF